PARRRSLDNQQSSGSRLRNRKGSILPWRPLSVRRPRTDAKNPGSHRRRTVKEPSAQRGCRRTPLGHRRCELHNLRRAIEKAYCQPPARKGARPLFYRKRRNWYCSTAHTVLHRRGRWYPEDCSKGRIRQVPPRHQENLSLLGKALKRLDLRRLVRSHRSACQSAPWAGLVPELHGAPLMPEGSSASHEVAEYALDSPAHDCYADLCN